MSLTLEVLEKGFMHNDRQNRQSNYIGGGGAWPIIHVFTSLTVHIETLKKLAQRLLKTCPQTRVSYLIVMSWLYCYLSSDDSSLLYELQAELIPLLVGQPLGTCLKKRRTEIFLFILSFRISSMLLCVATNPSASKIYWLTPSIRCM